MIGCYNQQIWMAEMCRVRVDLRPSDGHDPSPRDMGIHAQEVGMKGPHTHVMGGCELELADGCWLEVV